MIIGIGKNFGIVSSLVTDSRQATRNPFYLHAGRNLLDSIERRARTRCGYASLHNVNDDTREDRMESFFLCETCKYLYLVSE